MSGDINDWPYPAPPAAGSNGVGIGAIGAAPVGTLPAFNWRDTILSQYANSDRITGLIETFFDAVDQTKNFDAFYDNVWNLDTAVGYGLDVWGRIVGVDRVLQVADSKYFGFAQQLPGVAPWGVPPYLGNGQFGPVDPNGGGRAFYTGQALTSNYALSDEQYRRLIFAKAAANISSGSIPAINYILMSILFPGRGNCYVQEGSPQKFFGFAEARNTLPFGFGVFYNGEAIVTMSYRIVFRFALSPVDLAIIQNSGVLPKPAGVAATVSIQA